MKISKDECDKKWYLSFGRDNFANFINEWEQIFGKWNWYSFHFVHIYFEKDCMVEGYEFEFIILGLGFRIRINTFNENNEIYKSAKEIENGTAKTEPLESFQTDIFKQLIIPKENELLIKEALRKSAKELMKTKEYSDIKDYVQIDPEDALINICKKYNRIINDI